MGDLVESLMLYRFYAKATSCRIAPQIIDLSADHMGVLAKIKSGERLSAVFSKYVPEGFPLRFARFEQMEAVQREKDGKIFADPMGPVQIEELLVSPFSISTREEIEKKYFGATKKKVKKMLYNLLAQNLYVESFYYQGCKGYVPLDLTKMFVLGEDQLK